MYSLLCKRHFMLWAWYHVTENHSFSWKWKWLVLRVSLRDRILSIKNLILLEIHLVLLVVIKSYLSVLLIFTSRSVDYVFLWWNHIFGWIQYVTIVTHIYQTMSINSEARDVYRSIAVLRLIPLSRSLLRN